MHKFLHEVFKTRKKELNVTTKWIVEHTTLNDRTASRILSGESTDALFSNVLEFANTLGLSLGDLDPAFVEEFGGKRLNELMKEYLSTLQENAALKVQIADETNLSALNGQIDALLGKIDFLEKQNEGLQHELERALAAIHVHEQYLERDKAMLRPARRSYHKNKSK